MGNWSLLALAYLTCPYISFSCTGAGPDESDLAVGRGNLR